MKSAEDLEIENLDRYERVLADKHGQLSSSLAGNINRIREDLLTYEIDEKLLARVSDVMYEASEMDDIKSIEYTVKYLVDTFWNQTEEG